MTAAAVPAVVPPAEPRADEAYSPIGEAPFLERRHWLLLAAILVGTLVLRLALADHSLWFDEQASVYFSDQPLTRLWSDWMLRETNPPLYYSLLRGWRMLGSSDFAIRSLSVLVSVGAIAALFVVTRRIYGAQAGLLAALLAGVSGQHLYVAEQARAYIFVYFAAVVAIGGLATFVSPVAAHARRRRGLIAYAVATTIAIHCHSTMLLLPVVAVVAVAAVRPQQGTGLARLRDLLLANLGIAFASAWVIRIALLQTFARSDNMAAIGLVSVRQIASRTIRSLSSASYSDAIAYILGSAVLLLVALFVARDRQRPETRLLAALLLSSIVILGALGTVMPVFIARTIFWLTAPTTMLVAGAVTSVSRNALRRAVDALLVVVSAVDMIGTARSLQQEDWNTAVDTLTKDPRAAMAVHGEAMALLADNSCRRLRGGRCPYPIVAVMDPRDHFDLWATGAYAGPKVALDQLPGALSGRSVYLFRKAWFHNLPDVLHEQHMGRGVPANGPPLLGPLRADALR